ncbi:MAG TPA: Mur ligase family protein, partial [Phycisphaerales bacterium]|nr:Mur ligase family protein [Phycisphaerales bacterium]
MSDAKTSTLRRKKLAVEAPAPAPEVAADLPVSYQEALRYLAERVDVEKLRASRVTRDMFKLDRMRALLDALGNPHESLRCVHVAGTKGKGSTCEMTACCLEACGYTVGVYTSPHVVDVRERVRINRRLISYADFARTLSKVAEAASRLEAAHGPASYFEVLTALALAHFAEEAVDAAVIETGLGGRLDSTNVIVPEVAAITAIGLDHTQILGDTPELIAREKAGIFKPGVPALTVPQTPGVLAVLREAAGQCGVPLQVVGQDIEFSVRFENSGPRGPHARVCLTTPRSSFEHLPVPLP